MGETPDAKLDPSPDVDLQGGRDYYKLRGETVTGETIDQRLPF